MRAIPVGFLLASLLLTAPMPTAAAWGPCPEEDFMEPCYVVGTDPATLALCAQYRTCVGAGQDARTLALCAGHSRGTSNVALVCAGDLGCVVYVNTGDPGWCANDPLNQALQMV